MCWSNGGQTAPPAGFTVKSEPHRRSGRDLLCRMAGERIQDEHLRPVHMADAAISMSDVNDGTLDSLNRLAPFGAGNVIARLHG